MVIDLITSWMLDHTADVFVWSLAYSTAYHRVNLDFVQEQHIDMEAAIEETLKQVSATWMWSVAYSMVDMQLTICADRF